MNTVDVLRKAKELLSDERYWTQYGGWTKYTSTPQSYCALGALVYGSTGNPDPRSEHVNAPALRPAIQVLSDVIGGVGHPVAAVFEWNDETTHAELIDAFDRAILSLAPCEAEVLETVSAS